MGFWKWVLSICQCPIYDIKPQGLFTRNQVNNHSLNTVKYCTSTNYNAFPWTLIIGSPYNYLFAAMNFWNIYS